MDFLGWLFASSRVLGFKMRVAPQGWARKHSARRSRKGTKPMGDIDEPHPIVLLIFLVLILWRMLG